MEEEAQTGAAEAVVKWLMQMSVSVMASSRNSREVVEDKYLSVSVMVTDGDNMGVASSLNCCQLFSIEIAFNIIIIT